MSINGRGLLYAAGPILAGAVLFCEFGLDLNDVDRVNEIASGARSNNAMTNKRYYPFCITNRVVRYLRTATTTNNMFGHFSRPSRGGLVAGVTRNVILRSFDATDVTEDIDTYIYAIASADIAEGDLLVGPEPHDGIDLPLRLATSRPYTAAHFPANAIAPQVPENPVRFG